MLMYFRMIILGHPPQNARGPTPGGSNQRGGGIDGILAAAVPGISVCLRGG